MAATIVQPTSGNPLDPSCAYYGHNPTTCAYPINVTAGNEAYILATAGSNSVTLGTPVCSSGTATIGTFTAIGAGYSNVPGIQQWYRASITGSGSCTISVAVTGGSSNVGIFPFEVANDGGADSGTNPTYSGGNCSGPTCNNVSITTSSANDLVLYGIMGGEPNTYSALTPYTTSGTGPGSAGLDIAWMTGNYTAVSAGTVGGTFTTSGTVNYLNGVLAIKSGSSSGGGSNTSWLTVNANNSLRGLRH